MTLDLTVVSAYAPMLANARTAKMFVALVGFRESIVRMKLGFTMYYLYFVDIGLHHQRMFLTANLPALALPITASDLRKY